MGNITCKKCGTTTFSSAKKCPMCGAKIKTKGNTVLIVLIVIFGFIFFSFILSLTENSSNHNRTQTEEKSMEYMLAVIDNGYLKSDDIIIKRYKYLLTSIDNKTKENYKQVGNMTVKAQTQLEERYGVKISLLKILEDMNYTLPDNIELSYAEMTTLYIMLMGK